MVKKAQSLKFQAIFLLISIAVCQPLWAQTLKITTSAGSGGKIVSSTGSKTVSAGGNISFYLLPSSPAYEVSDVKVDNVSVGRLSQYSFSNVTANHKLSVLFKKRIFQVQTSIQGATNGSFSPLGTFSLSYGKSKTFRAKPNPGYIAQLYDNGSKVAESSLSRTLSYTLKRVTAHHDIKAFFTLPGGNTPPLAFDLSQTADPALPYQEIQLLGNDPNNDSITFELISPESGTGYESAYLNPDGKLFITLSPGFQGSIPLSFRVTDGKTFSEPATLSLLVQSSTGDKGTGALVVDPKQYSSFDHSRLASTLLGAPGTAPTEPSSVDLSLNFPTPGDQGRQGSCVAWAVGYALKSYQEGIEENWSLNTASHLFSPAYIYNQVNGGKDNGSQIYDALDIIINKGAATLATMPYSDQDFLLQPNENAKTEAVKFKALHRSTLSNLSDLKGALAQHKPVVLGIEVYDQFYKLKGTNSVYNSKAGTNDGPHGKHAVTAVGYDNNQFGGAVKVINSWGTSWGDNGFFWMPYSFFPTVTFQMWVLDDAKNVNVAPSPDPVPPPVNADLADLQIKSWSANLDYTVGGQGKLEWEVFNAGQGSVPPGATVSLLLSKDSDINANDTFVVYEPIPFSLTTGESAYRSFAENSGIPFQIPSTLEPGTYYLGLMVDDLDRIQESDETNNTSLSEGTVSFTNTQADLEINTWYANWNDFTGYGLLTYEIFSVGGKTVPAGWGVSLVLTSLSDFNELYILARDENSFDLPVGESAYRNDNNAKSFNVYRDSNFNAIPIGIYYMALLADDTDLIAESDELNNISYSQGLVYNYGFGAAQASQQTSAKSAQMSAPENSQTHTAYNGRHLPGKATLLRKVKVTANAQGIKSLQVLDDTSKPEAGTVNDRLFSKTLRSKDVAVFPVNNRHQMSGQDIQP